MTDWTGVRDRVLALAGTPGGAEYFGARYHGFRLEEPLTAAELADVESLLRVELPEDYRTFLLQVGAGGAGPAYGLFPLRRGGGRAWRWIGDGADLTDPSLLAEPFPGCRSRSGVPGVFIAAAPRCLTTAAASGEAAATGEASATGEAPATGGLAQLVM